MGSYLTEGMPFSVSMHEVVGHDEDSWERPKNYEIAVLGGRFSGIGIAKTLKQLILWRRSTEEFLDGAVAIVTGGARGIGAATAAELSARGATVWIGDVDHEVAAETAAGIRRAQSARLDVTDPDSWAEFVDRIETESGPIDLLVNNAGIMPLGAFADDSDQTIDLTFAVNVRGNMNGMRAVLPGMVARGHGHIVNVASMAGMIPVPGMVVYNASKFASVGASLAARREYAGTGVSISAVLPTAVRTEPAQGVTTGGGVPAVEPEEVSKAIINTISTRAACASVPAWIVPLWRIVELVPQPVQDLVRRIINDQRVLALDTAARQPYTDRMRRQSREHAELKA